MGSITAVGMLRGHEIKATVINPCGWYGKVFLIAVEDSFDPTYFAVEADSYDDAINTFVDSGVAPSSVLIDVDGPEKDDYAIKYDSDDEISRKHFSDLAIIPEGVAFAITLGNRLVLETDPAYEHLQAPSMTDQGTYYDDDHVFIHGDDEKGWKCRYYGENLPQAGLCPVIYRDMKFSDVDLVEEN